MGSKLLWPAALCLKESPWESNYGMSEAVRVAGSCQRPRAWAGLVGPGPPAGEMQELAPGGGMGDPLRGTGITEIAALLSFTRGPGIE